MKILNSLFKVGPCDIVGLTEEDKPRDGEGYYLVIDMNKNLIQKMAPAIIRPYIDGKVNGNAAVAYRGFVVAGKVFIENNDGTSYWPHQFAGTIVKEHETDYEKGFITSENDFVKKIQT